MGQIGRIVEILAGLAQLPMVSFLLFPSYQLDYRLFLLRSLLVGVIFDPGLIERVRHVLFMEKLRSLMRVLRLLSWDLDILMSLRLQIEIVFLDFQVDFLLLLLLLVSGPG